MSHSDLKLFLKLFLSILLSVLFIFTFTYAGAYSYEQVINNNKANEQLTVGSLHLENTSYRDIYYKVKDHTMRWKTEANLSLRFQDLIITIPTEVVSFDIEASVKEAMKSGSSPLYVKVDQQTFEEQLAPFQEYNVLANINKVELQNDLITIASSLESNQITLDLVKYLSKEELLQQTVSEKEITNISSSSTLIKWAEAIDGFVIEPESSISMLQMMKQRGLEPAESESLNILASGIYSAVLSTNFEIIERHIGRKKISYINLGHEAKVVPQKKDLVFYNPNTLPYKFQINVSQNMLTVSLVGFPFFYSYHVTVEEQTFQPKTIVQYNAVLPFDEKRIKEKGQQGYLAAVYRTVIDQNGQVIEKQHLSEDFYPPIHQVEEWGWPNSQSYDEANPPSEINQNPIEKQESQENQEDQADDPANSNKDKENDTDSSSNDDNDIFYDPELIIK